MCNWNPKRRESRKKNEQTFLKFGERHTFSLTTFSEPQASRIKGASGQGGAKLADETALRLRRVLVS